jgi:hypothetical protein
MLSHRKGVLLDGIGSELVRASTGGARKTLSAWLSLISNLGSTAITAVMAPLVQAATKAAGWAFFALNNARTSHHGTNDAALTAAKAAAGVGGLIIVDNALVLTSTATTAGYTLRFEGGTISPPASGNTLTVGKIEASPSQQIFVGANIAQVRCNADCDGVYPEWFYGAASDFLGFAAPLAATQLASGILLRGAEYATSVKVTIGNGTNTTRSTIHNGFFMRGGSDGVGAGEFGSPNLLTSIKWTGTDSTASTVVQIDGGIHSVVLENFAINCNATAGVGILEYHKYRCSVRRVYVHNWKAGPQFAWDMAARDNAAYLSGGGAGVTQGYMENTYQDWGCRTPPSGVGNCISMAGGKTNNIGFSRNSFDNTQWVRGDDSASISLSYSFVDNNTFDDPLAVSSNALPYTGTALRRLTQSGGSFPKENSFYGCELVGAIITVDDVTLTTSTDGGQDCAYGYGALDDGASTSMPFGFRAATTKGQLLGNGWTVTNSTATTAADYLMLKPSDYGSNKPGLFLSKSATQDRWLLQAYDGTDNDGTLVVTFQTEIELNATLFDLNGALDLSGASTLTGTVTTGGAIELGHASDTTLTRASAGVLAVEGVNVLTTATGVPASGGTFTGGVTFNNDINLATGADQYLYFDGALHISKNGTGEAIGIDSSRVVTFTGGGVLIGAATGGAKGSGTLNLAADIYKNDTAFTNPDYVFEHAYRGEIVQFAEKPGAASYAGPLTLDDLDAYTRKNLRLPGITDEPMGMFERGDKVLEKLEELTLYVIQLHRRIAELEANASAKS